MKQLEALNEELLEFYKKLTPNEDIPLVFGNGNSEHPRIMLIGEAPGEQEVAQRKPFVGKAGKNLDEFLLMAHLNREEIYVSNVVKLRPTALGPTGRTKNRAPSKEEIALFLPWLKKEIALVSPEIVVTLGNVPLRALMGKTYTIGECHGQWLHMEDGRTLYALYHPASVIYRRDLKPVYEQDVRLLGDEMTIGT